MQFSVAEIILSLIVLAFNSFAPILGSSRGMKPAWRVEKGKKKRAFGFWRGENDPPNYQPKVYLKFGDFIQFPWKFGLLLHFFHKITQKNAWQPKRTRHAWQSYSIPQTVNSNLTWIMTMHQLIGNSSHYLHFLKKPYQLVQDFFHQQWVNMVNHHAFSQKTFDHPRYSISTFWGVESHRSDSSAYAESKLRALELLDLKI